MKRYNLIIVALLFTLCKSQAQQLTSAEYFFDTDPGLNNGTSLAVSTGDSILYSGNISAIGLQNGIHFLYIRAKDNNGIWSIAERRMFYIQNISANAPQLVAAEYFVNTDPGIGNGTPIAVTQGDSIDFIGPISITETLVANYTLFIRVKDALGKWSLYEPRDFTICAIAGAISNFEYAKEGLDVNLINTSENNVSNHWDFGDGDTSNLINPFHHYNSAGIYNVCLIASNSCGIDTICQVIELNGIQSISPNDVANTGTYPIDIFGAGFDSLASFSLTKTGESPIVPDTIIAIDNNNFKAIFTFNTVTSGSWTPQVVFANADTSRLFNGLNISNPEDPKLWVNVSGDFVLRVGFNQVYTITVGNDGNTDAYFPHLFIEGLPDGTKFEFLDSIFSGSIIPNFDTLSIDWDSLSNEIFIDSSNMTSFNVVTIYKVPANSVITINVIFHIPDTTQLHTYYDIKAFVTGPLFSSLDPDAAARMQTLTSECSGQLLSLVLNFIIEEAGGVVNDWVLCAADIAQTANEINEAMKDTSELAANWNVLWNTPAITQGILSSVTQCVLASGNFILYARLAKTLLHLKRFFKYYNDYRTVETGIDILNCPEEHKSKQTADESSQSTIIGNAWDPNDKIGPGTGSFNHYTNDENPFVYSIRFENDSAAAFPAQTIRIYDTLDVSKFDLNTFSFTSVTLGKKTLSLNDTKCFFGDIDFSAEYGVNARVTGQLDTSTGVISWILNTIDPLTNQITTNISAGFLPPDSLSPYGQGNVNFIVNLLPSVTNGDSVQNRATIIFDFNAPILTPIWQSSIDTIKPQSILSASTPVTTDDSVLVTWAGSDVFSEIRSYTLYFSTDGITYIPWLTNTSATSAYFYTNLDTTYYFYSLAKDSAGNIEDAQLFADDSTTFITSINDITSLNETILFQNRPNPFNNSTVIDFYLHKPANVTLYISDILGHVVKTIKDEKMNSGKHSVEINGELLYGGYYFYKMVTSDFTDTKRMILLK